MKRMYGHVSLVCFVALCLFLGSLEEPFAGRPKDTRLSPMEQKEYERIRKRLFQHRDVLNKVFYSGLGCDFKGYMQFSHRL